MPHSGVRARAKRELLYHSSETCSLLPRASTDAHVIDGESNVQPNKNTVESVVMDEPFYIKGSTLAEAGLATLLSPNADNYVYVVSIILRSTSSHSENSWPFAIDTTPSTTPMKLHRQESSANSSPSGSKNRSSSRNGSPLRSSLSPSPRGTRHSPRARKPTASALATANDRSGSQGLRSSTFAPPVVSPLRRRAHLNDESAAARSDCDADDEDEDGEVEENYNVSLSSLNVLPGIALCAEYSFSLIECPGPGTVLPLQFRKNGIPMEVKSGLEIGIEIDTGWSVPTTEDHLNAKEKIARDQYQQQEKVLEAKQMSEDQRLSGTKRDDTTRTSTPMSDHATDSVEARYHFALDGKFKTFVLQGFGCPWCYMKDYGSCERLHFHLLTCHDLFTFRVDMRKPILMDVYVSITGQFLYERASTRVLDIRLMQWLRPRHLKFKMSAFLRGDITWLQEGVSLLMLRLTGGSETTIGQQLRVASSASGVSNGGVEDGAPRLSLISAMTTTMYDVQTVPALPPKARRVLPVPETDSTLYTTKSKRPLRTGEEMSESEDDNDDTWLITKHEEVCCFSFV